MPTICFLCQRECELYPSPSFDGTIFDCPSCGSYGVTRSAAITYDGKKFAFERERASHIAAERYVHDMPPFFIATANGGSREFLARQSPLLQLETLLENYPQDSVEILDRSLLNLAHLNEYPGKSFEIRRIACGQETLPERSISFCRNWNDFICLILFLEREGCVEIESVLREAKTGRALSNVERAVAATQFVKLPLLILPKGLQRVRELKSKAAGDQSQAFVAMWFDESRKGYYDHIERAAKDAGFEKCLKIDNKEHNNKICDEIIAEIRKSQCVIADFTGNRGGVYFEAGFALGLGIPVIWLVDTKQVDDLHFDTRQYAHIVYKDGEDLYEKLKARILATVPIGK